MFLKNIYRTTITRTAKLIFTTAFAMVLFTISARSQNKLAKGEHFAEINGFRMHYFVSGCGPVCLLPSAGWGIPIEYIMPLRVFEKHFTMVYYDTRLSGKSSGPADSLRYTADDYMQDTDSLRVYLGQSKIWLAGHSMGGFQVLNYGTQHNDKLNGLIVMSSIIKFDQSRREQRDDLISRRKTYPYFVQHPDQYEKAAAILTGKDKKSYTLKQSFDITGGFYCHDPKIGQKVFSKILFRDSVDHYVDKSDFYGKDVFSHISAITVPTLVICGDDDFVCDHISQSDRIHEQIALSELVILKNCGHMLWAEQPAAFNAACTAWFKEQHL